MQLTQRPGHPLLKSNSQPLLPPKNTQGKIQTTEEDDLMHT